MPSLVSVMGKLAKTATEPPNPACLDEECILQWVQRETQMIQAYYDEALDLGLQPEELEEVEELYAHKLNEVVDTGLRMLGVKEV